MVTIADREAPMGLFWGEESDGGYTPSWWHRRMRPDVSGNAINGLGEQEKRRPTPVYHRQDTWHPWRWVQDAFYVRVALQPSAFAKFLRSNILDARTPAPVAPEPVVAPPDEWTRRVREKAHALGVDEVGIVRVSEDLVFAGDEIPEAYAVLLATRMDRDAIARSLDRGFEHSLGEAMRVYLRGNVAAKALANWLREQGHPARGFGSPMGTPLNLVHAAERAGLGQLGKHGSLIHPRLGPMFRLAYVLTDLPLVAGEPVDIGVDDFCTLCDKCSSACPPQAIFTEKQWVRGDRKWYVDFDACVPYFNENKGCGICLAACPYGEPGVAENLVEKMLRRRERVGASQPHGPAQGL